MQQQAPPPDEPKHDAASMRPLTPAEKMITGGGAVSAPAEQPSAENLAVLRARARTHVEEAIKAIPAAEKVAYLEALEKAPEVVAAESDPLPFIRICDYNVWEAARRIICYWKERKELFGPERFFLPLNLTGEGALTQADVLSLRAGFPVLLPDACKDGQKQQVVLCDRGKNLRTATWQMRLRGGFYLVNLLAQDERAQSIGVILLILLVTPRMLEFDAAQMRKGFQLSANALPIRWNIHLLNSLPKTTKRRYAVQDTVTSYISHIVELYTTKNLQVHFEREKGQLLQELQELGLKPEGIPDSLGGSWSFAYFQQWCRERAIAERKESKKGGRRAVARAGTHRVTSQDKKTSNVLYARRKRLRDKQELNLLNAENANLTRERDRLRAEQQLFHNLLREAQNVLANLAGAGADAEAIEASLMNAAAVAGTTTEASWAGQDLETQAERRKALKTDPREATHKKAAFKEPNN